MNTLSLPCLLAVALVLGSMGPTQAQTTETTTAQNPVTKAKADTTAKEVTGTLVLMPNDFVTFRVEYLHRSANAPYFAGHGGTTSPSGYADQPLPASYVPDLRDYENRVIFAVNFRL